MGPAPTDESRDSGLLAEAVQVFLEQGMGSANEAEVLASHPHLREHLEPMLAASRATIAAPSYVMNPLQVAVPDLNRPPNRIGPYRVLEPLGEGGMGVVYLADQTAPVRRRVALKLLKLGLDTKEFLGRFEAERQALALMTHPGIAQVYDAGSLEDGRPFFAMEHVAGSRITEYCDANRLGTEERLKLVIEVCQAVQHAHRKGIIHRDLKPSNILVTLQDSKPVPKIIDFGIAKALDQRLSTQTFFTSQGKMIGTPEYMSPEQADSGGLDIDTRSDIYSLGVVLYELLMGELPFEEDKLRDAGFAGIGRILNEQSVPRPSTRLSSLDEGRATEIAERRGTNRRTLTRGLRGDLDWIVLKCLERDRTRRYGAASELAADIERFLAHEPVLAGPPTTRYRLQKFIGKHRVSVGVAVSFLVLLVAGLVTSLVLLERAQREHGRADHNLQLANERYDELVRISDVKRLSEAESLAEELWPACPANIAAMKQWIEERGEPLARNLSEHRAALLELRATALEYDDAQRRDDVETHPDAAELAANRDRLEELNGDLALLAQWEDSEEKTARITRRREKLPPVKARIAELERRTLERRTWRFPDSATQWRHDTLVELVADLERFSATDGTLSDVRDRIAFAETLAERSISGEEASRAWRSALADIEQLDHYAGLELAPQLGVFPLHRDGESDLWEFWHVASGERPTLGVDGRWELTEKTGLVFVLLPGGSFSMGAQSQDPEAPNYDKDAEFNEDPVHTVSLAAFFVSKFEMTQGQWYALTGENPGRFQPPRSSFGGKPVTWTDPAERVSWHDCMKHLPRIGLVLPTEAQWEYGARAGTTDPWWTGRTLESLDGAANLIDRSHRNGASSRRERRYEEWLEDGFVIHSPVGTYRPNPFGLHDVIGNVEEWCLDGYRSPYARRLVLGTGEHRVPLARTRVTRGGSWDSLAIRSRSARRSNRQPDQLLESIGVRPAMLIQE